MDEWMDERSWFFACWCKFRKVKNYFNNVWVVVFKTAYRTLTSEWMDESECFLHANTYPAKLEVTLIVVEWAWSNMGAVF